MSDEQTQPDEILSPEAQIEELTNNWKRTAADFENYKKRRESESKELLEFAKEVTVMKLMPTLQSLEMVLKFAPDDEKYNKTNNSHNRILPVKIRRSTFPNCFSNLLHFFIALLLTENSNYQN